MTMRVLVMALLLAGVPITPTAQTLKLAVAVRHTGEDTVGRQFAYRLRESIRGSHGFVLSDEEHALAILSLLSIDRECAQTGNGSLVAVVYLNHNAQYMMGGLHSVGLSRIDDAVTAVLADLDQHSQGFRKAFHDPLGIR